MRTILVDMDGTIADWGAAFDRYLDRYGNAAAGIKRHREQTTFNLYDGCTPKEAAVVDAVMDAPGFYAGLEPIPGALDALVEMVDAGHDVALVTSPWPTNPTCASDKLTWVLRHLGYDWAHRTIITSDKTRVHGDYLIDDKPTVTGSLPASWEHVLYSQPYNKDIARPRITDWADWKEVIA